MDKKSFVYIGLKEGPRGGYYIKIGKSDNPRQRKRQYFTHCPGGLLSMHAAECRSSAAAFAKESMVARAIKDLPRAWSAGGEWVYVPGDMLEDVFSEFERIAGQIEVVNSGFDGLPWVDCTSPLA